MPIFYHSAFAQPSQKLTKVIEEYLGEIKETEDVLWMLNSEIKSVRHAAKLTPDYKDKYIEDFLNQVRDVNIQLDMRCYQAAIKTFKLTKNVNYALKLFAEIEEIGLKLDIVLYNMMISVCITGGDYDVAMDIFQKGIENGIYLESKLAAKELNFHIESWFTQASIDRLIELKKVDPGHICGISSSMLFMLLEQIEFQDRGLSGRTIIVGYNGRSILRNAVSEFLDYYHYNYTLNPYGKFVVGKKRKFHKTKLSREGSLRSIDESPRSYFIKKFASESLSYAAACSTESPNSEPMSDAGDFLNEEQADDHVDFDEFDTNYFKEAPTVPGTNFGELCGTYAKICMTPKEEMPKFSMLTSLKTKKFAVISTRRSLLNSPSSLCSASDSTAGSSKQESEELVKPEQQSKLNPQAAIFVPKIFTGPTVEYQLSEKR